MMDKKSQSLILDFGIGSSAMDFSISNELASNVVTDMHSHFTNKRQSYSKNFRSKLSVKNQNTYDESQDETLKNLIKSANSQLHLLINGPTYKRDYPTLVRVYIVFLKVGEIDNVKERFQADAYIEASWEDNSIDPKHQNSSFDPKCYWNPDLYIENSLGNLNQTIKYKTEKTANGIRVVEMRTIKGSFWEKLELGEFPLDVQDLSITITSHRQKDEVIIDLSKERDCCINTEEFRMQQEWCLYPHINTDNRTIYDIKSKYEKPGFTFSSKISRRPGYYIYNCYMLIFTISGLGFVPFAFNAYQAHFRIQTTCLLILSSVNFRLIVTKSLPTVSYLTTLDIYAIVILLFLILLCCWHAIIGTFLLDDIIDRPMRVEIDINALYIIAFFYIMFHVVYFIFFVYKYLRYSTIEKEELVNEELKKMMRETINTERIEQLKKKRQNNRMKQATGTTAIN